MIGAVTLGWINTFLLGFLGVLLLSRYRDSSARWFAAYALIVAVLGACYKLFLFDNFWFYIYKYLIGHLVLLGATMFILKKETGRFPFWGLPALAMITVLPLVDFFFTKKILYTNLIFYLPEMGLMFGLGFSMATVLKRKISILYMPCFLGIFLFVGNLLKLFMPAAAQWTVLQMLDSWGFTVMASGMIIQCQWHRVMEFAIKNQVSILPHSEMPVRKLVLVPTATPQSSELTLSASLLREHAVEPDALESLLERIKNIENIVLSAAFAEFLSRKTFLSTAELSVFLGSSVEIAGEFVKKHNISRINVGSDDWVVRRDDVESIILDI